MHRRDLLIGACVAAATGSSTASAAPAATAPAPAQAAPPWDVQLLRYKYKPGGRPVWDDWVKELNQRRAEVEATMRQEESRLEVCFLSSDGESVFFFAAEDNYERATQIFLHSHDPIDHEDAQHRAASLQFVERLTPVFNFRAT